MSEPTVLLINPWVYDFALFDLYLKPLGLLYIASHLKKCGVNVLLLDCLNRFDEYFVNKNLIFNKKYGTGKYYYEIIDKPEILKFMPRYYKRYGLPYEVVKERLKFFRENYKISAILITSTMTYWYLGLFEMIKLVKSIFKNVPVIIGGLYVSLMPEHAKNFSNADYVIPGNNLKYIIEKIFKIIGFNNSKEIPFNFEDWEEPDFSFYGKNLPYLVLLTSLGCPFKCSYCSTQLLYNKFTSKSYEKLLKNIIEYKTDNIAFYDDAFLFNFANIKKLLFEIEKYNLKFNFHAPNGLHIRFLTEEVAEILFKYNFKTIRLSYETSDILRQKETGGKTTTEELKKAIKNLISAGYKQKDIEVYILAGFVDQTREEVIKSIETVKNLGAVPKIVEYSPIPNTLEFKKIFGKNFIDPLLHNNSVFYVKFSKITIDDMIFFRSYAKL